MPSNQRRLLLLKQLLDKETDCEHKISIQEIIDRLKPSLPTMKMDARTIRADLDALDKASFSVYSEKGKFGKLLYSRGDRLFSNTELRLLIDAVLNAHFLPVQEKKRLTEGLKALASRQFAQTLPEVLLKHYGPGWLFENVQSEIGVLQRAIGSSHCIDFSYRAPDGESEKKIAAFAPYVLTWQEDFCFIVGKCNDTGLFDHFRVDRLHHVKLLEEEFERTEFDFQLYAERHFFLFSRRGEEVVLRFSESVGSRLIEQFGPALHMEQDREGRFTVKVRTLRLDALQSWLMQWGREVEVLKPDVLRLAIKKEIACMQAIYEDRTGE